jgi:hypothetical protein
MNIYSSASSSHSFYFYFWKTVKSQFLVAYQSSSS